MKYPYKNQKIRKQNKKEKKGKNKKNPTLYRSCMLKKVVSVSLLF